MDPSIRRHHRYTLTVIWTGNRGEGTRSYAGYSRDHQVSAAGKPPLQGSSDPAFRGDPGRWSPEELLVAALSQCHMLSYLHVCSAAGIVVTAYEDTPEGVMAERRDGAGEFTEVVLRPRVTLEDWSRAAEAQALHERAHELCFIARSVNFPVRVEPAPASHPAPAAAPPT
jgi:organic hydroperoxide reductase OsmC/OhrA